VTALIDALTSSEAAERWKALRLLTELETRSGRFMSSFQLQQLHKLSEQAQMNASPGIIDGLFPTGTEIQLGSATWLNFGLKELPGEKTVEASLQQLLPYWIGSATDTPREGDLWMQALGGLEVTGQRSSLAARIRQAVTRVSRSQETRVAQFARSAHYMGSKAALAPLLNEILHTLQPAGSTVIDLMCGSGTAAGAFSREWRTLASDAQSFSRYLGVVQGGGMTAVRARSIAEKTLGVAREHFNSLPSFVNEQVTREAEFLSAEFTDETASRFFEWIRRYPRISNEAFAATFGAEITKRRFDAKTVPYLLFTAYYANLFFGVRQAAEIDSLRFAIDQLHDPLEKDWAMGALVCAVSSCAFAYGGHFAQPKLALSTLEKFTAQIKDIVESRGLSVSHEFFVRLCSLGQESEAASFPVERIDGPWENALHACEQRVGESPVCVYFDPPYTRDEYSRYYHVLETLTLYNYPTVADKPSIPVRGANGRFGSAFATRNVSQVEKLLADVLSACLTRGWNCLWSYSDSGVADIATVLKSVQGMTDKIDLFSMNHTYKAQGRRKAKPVKEFAIFLNAKSKDS